MTVSRRAAIGAVLAASACSAATPSPDAAEAVVDAVLHAQAVYDGAALDRLLGADYLEISPVGKIDRREEVLGFYTPEAKARDGNPVVEVASTPIATLTDGGVVVLTKRVTYHTTLDSGPLPPMELVATFVCREQDGWKVASAQYTRVSEHDAPT